MSKPKIESNENGVKVGTGIWCGFIRWEDLNDVIVTLQNLEQDHASSENLEHEYESL